MRRRSGHGVGEECLPFEALPQRRLAPFSADRSGLPATLSRPILTGLLRKQLRFRGVIVTDSLDMSGASVMPRERVAVQAVKAGADILLNPPDVPLAYRALGGT